MLAGLRLDLRPARAGLVAATVLWAWVTLDDYRALAREVAGGAWPTPRGDAAAVLDAQGEHALWGEFRVAYVVSFLSQERVKVASTSFHRIDEYAALAREVPGAPILTHGPCQPDQWTRPVVPGIMICGRD